jgi:hypothetical protein
MHALGIRREIYVVRGLVLLNALREELVDEEDNQVNGLFLHRGVNRVVKDSFHNFLHKFLDVVETLSNLFAVFL